MGRENTNDKAAKYRNKHRESLRVNAIEYRLNNKEQIKERKHLSYLRHNHKHPCKNCGGLITSKAIRCHSCAIKERWKIGELVQAHHKRPEKRIGRKRIDGGYIKIYLPKYPGATKRGYVQEHTFVWEQSHKKPLPDGWMVHHLNGIKNDNRPCNLEAMPRGKHHAWLVQQSMARRIQELEALLNNQGHLL